MCVNIIEDETVCNMWNVYIMHSALHLQWTLVFWAKLLRQIDQVLKLSHVKMILEYKDFHCTGTENSIRHGEKKIPGSLHSFYCVTEMLGMISWLSGIIY